MEIILQIILEPICYAYADILESIIHEKPNKFLKGFLGFLCFIVFSASVTAAILGILALIGIIEINTPLLIYIIVGTSLFLLHIAIVVIAFLLDKKNNDDELKNKLDLKENEPIERYFDGNDETDVSGSRPQANTDEEKNLDPHVCEFDPTDQYGKQDDSFIVHYDDNEDEDKKF